MTHDGFILLKQKQLFMNQELTVVLQSLFSTGFGHHNKTEITTYKEKEKHTYIYICIYIYVISIG